MQWWVLDRALTHAFIHTSHLLSSGNWWRHTVRICQITIFKICTLEPPLGKWMWTLMNIITRARYLWWSLHCVKWTTVIGPRRWGLLVGTWALGFRMSDLYISWRTLQNSSCWCVYYIPCFPHKGGKYLLWFELKINYEELLTNPCLVTSFMK